MDTEHLLPGLNHPDNDKRILALNQLKEELNTTTFSDADSLATALRQSIKSNNSHVASAALAVLPPFFRSLADAADPFHLKQAFSLLLPFDKLGDAKLPTRTLAREAVVSAVQASLKLGLEAGTGGREKEGPWQVLERGMQDFGFRSKNAKAREQSLHFLEAVRCPPSNSSLPLPPLRPFTVLLLPLLADSDSAVRSLALSTTIDVFTHHSVTSGAKSDLKKEMIKLDVAKKVQDQILAAVLGGGGPGPIERSPSQASLSSLGGKSDSSRGGAIASSSRSGSISAILPPPVPSIDGPARRTRSQQASTSSSATHTPSLLSSLPAAAFPSDPSAIHAPSSSDISPVYIASERDLRAEFDAMKVGFAGKETEHNWQNRDKSVAKMRGMVLGGVANGKLQAAFVKAVKEVAEGITKTASSLRTTLAISALSLISDLTLALPPSQVDLFLDPFLSHTLSMSGQTKKIVVTASQSTVTTLLERSTYHLRTIQLVSSCLSDKIVGARQQAAQHLTTFLRVHAARSRGQIESSGGADELEAAVTKGLLDANAVVRENVRIAFWVFERVWPQRAERVMAALDANGRKLLEKVRPASESSNGTAMAAVVAPLKKATVSVAPPSTASEGAAPKKLSVREMMMAARKKKQQEEQEAAANGGGEPANEYLPEEPSAASTPPRQQAPEAQEGQEIVDSPTTPIQPSRESLSPSRSVSTAKGAFSPQPSGLPSLSPSPLSPSSEPVDGDFDEEEEEAPTPSTPNFRHTNDLMHSPSPFRLRTPLPSASPPLAASSSAPQHAGSPLATPSRTPRSLPKPSYVTPMHSNPSQSSLASSTSASIDFSRSPRTTRAGSLVPDAVVDDALRDQAMQAEQAAERLLELAEDEEEEAREAAAASALSSRVPSRAETPKPVRVLPSPHSNGNGMVASAGVLQTPAMNPARRRLAALGGGKTFEDSPDPKDGSGGAGRGTWWVRRGENLPPPPPLAPDSQSRAEEIGALVSSLQSLSIDATGLRKISALSKERPVREVEAESEDEEGSGLKVTDNATGTTTAKFWSEERRFDKVYEGLRGFLLKEGGAEAGMTRDIALLLLKDLVDNQFPCFAGEESGLFSLLFKLREDPSRTSIAATESIATLFASRLEPVYGLGCLNPSLAAYLSSASSSTTPSDAIARSYALGLKLMRTFFEGLPDEVLEDVLPSSKDLLKQALNDAHSGDLRRAAITALVSADSVLRDEQRLTELIGGLPRDQANLLAYYCAKKRGV